MEARNSRSELKNEVRATSRSASSVVRCRGGRGEGALSVTTGESRHGQRFGRAQHRDVRHWIRRIEVCA
eukprot:scaffold869_cov105-Isochrysis_galbana.AAC.21